VVWSLCSSGCWNYGFGFGIVELSTSYFVNSVQFLRWVKWEFYSVAVTYVVWLQKEVKTWLCYCSITFVVTSIRWIFVQILSKVIVPLIYFILVHSWLRNCVLVYKFLICILEILNFQHRYTMLSKLFSSYLHSNGENFHIRED